MGGIVLFAFAFATLPAVGLFFLLSYHFAVRAYTDTQAVIQAMCRVGTTYAGEEESGKRKKKKCIIS